MFRAQAFDGSFNVAIVQQKPAVAEERHEQPYIVDFNGHMPRLASRDEVQVLFTDFSSPAKRLLPRLVYMGTRIGRQPEKPFHRPNEGFMVQGAVPDLFLDASGTFNNNFQDSIIADATHIYRQRREPQGEVQPAKKTMIVPVQCRHCAALPSTLVYSTVKGVRHDIQFYCITVLPFSVQLCM